MKQLYSAGPLPTSDSHDAAGEHAAPVAAAPPAVKASSAGLGPDRVYATLPLTGYAPPPGRDAEERAPLPVRLALLNSPSTGRVLTHVAPTGGGYFAHALLDLPATTDAQTAIQTWGSPLWQRHDPETAADLPDLPYLPVADVLDDAALKEWLAAPARRDLLEFALAGLLSGPADGRVFLAAPADDVARVVYAVTRALPPALVDDFTFSTYESDPLGCYARLVGHDPGPGHELPDACYSGFGVGLNVYTGRRSELRVEVPFAAFAVKCLADGDYSPLDEFRGNWQRLGLRDASQFDLVYRLARGTGTLTKDEATEALAHPPLAAWVSARADALKQFLDWALDDRQFASVSFGRAVVALRQKPDVVAKLAETVKQHGLAAIKTGDRERASVALEVILPMAAPAKANAVWGEVLAQATDPSTLPWDLRWHLLPRLVRFKHPSGPVTAVDKALAKWLDVPAEKLGELLAIELPRAYHQAAAKACLARDAEPVATVARAVASQPALVQYLLQPSDTVSEDRAVELYDALLTEAPDHAWFEDVLANAASFPAGRRNRFFESVQAAGRVDADRLIRARGPTLFDLFTGQSGLDKLARKLFAEIPADLLREPLLLDFLTRLRDEPLVGADVKARAEAALTVRRYLDAPEPSADALKPVAAALTLDPPAVPPTAKGDVLEAVAADLSRRAESPEFQNDLESVLLNAGGVLADSPATLYRELLRRERTRRDFVRQPNMLHAFLAVALGAIKSEELAKQLDGLEGEAFAVAAEAGKKGRRRLLSDLDARSADWPKSARTQWGFLLAAVRPQGIGRTARDVLFLLAGAAIASGVWYVIGQVGT